MAIPENTDRWYTTEIVPCWVDHQRLNFVNEPFNDDASVQHWRDLGYTQTKFTGDMYDMRQPEPKWMDAVKQQFSWQHLSWSVYRMSPGTVLPNHSDTYAKFRLLHDIQDPDLIWRAVIFLEPWQSGHYFEIDGVPFVNWQAGHTVVWRNDVPHLAANMGATYRYTLQITGIIP